MSARAAGERKALRLPAFRRPAAAALLVCSALFLLNDAAAFRIDLFFEALARFGMLLLALLLLLAPAGSLRYAHQRELLLWGLLGLSLDLYWQLAYGGIFAWIAMTVKFAGVSAGLGCLIALTASFSNGGNAGRFGWIGERIVAPALTGAMLLSGMALGVAWLRDCAAAAGGCYVNDPSAMLAYHSYLAVDSLARSTIVAFSIVALILSPANRQRLLLVAASCIALGAGTALDFTLREVSLGPTAVSVLQLFDALCTLAFVAGLFVALTKKQIFDVNLYVSRAVAYGGTFVLMLLLVTALSDAVPRAVLAAAAFIALAAVAIDARTLVPVRLLVYAGAALALFVVFTLAEGTYHWAAALWLEGAIVKIPLVPWAKLDPKLVADVALAGVCSLTLNRFEERASRWIEGKLMPESEKRVKRLEQFRRSLGLFTRAADLERMLVDAVVAGIEAEFAHLFLRKHSGIFEAAATCPASLEPPAPVSQEQLPPPLMQPRCTHCEESDAQCVTGARLFAPMRYSGAMTGFFAAGPKHCENGECYSKRELRELDALAKEAAAVLHELEEPPS